MNDCSWLSDRMPSVALGRSAWTGEETSHLGSCRSCQDEWDLIRLSSRMGKDVAAELDPAATTRAVLGRLARSREEARLRQKAWGFAALAGAAAAAVMVWAGRPATIPVPAARAPVVASLQIPLPELDYLLPAELNAVLQTMDEPYVGGSPDAPAWGDPDDEVLDSGFVTWEG
jgi:hypothetical protein